MSSGEFFPLIPYLTKYPERRTIFRVQAQAFILALRNAGKNTRTKVHLHMPPGRLCLELKTDL